MSRETIEGEHRGHQPRARGVPPARAEVAPHVGVENDVDVLEHALADIVRLGGNELFSDSGPDLDRTGKSLGLHQILHS